MIAAVLKELMAAGLAGDALLAAVERIEAAEAAEFRGIPVDVSAEKRRAYDRERKRTKKLSGGIPVEIPRNSNVFLYNKKDNNISSKKERGRAERIPPEFQPDLDFPLSRGMSRKRAETEAEKFKNYWSAKSGRDAAKLDWPATWRNWVLSSLERTGPDATPPPSEGNRLADELAIIRRQFAEAENGKTDRPENQVAGSGRERPDNAEKLRPEGAAARS
jgi:hypothetical protein